MHELESLRKAFPEQEEPSEEATAAARQRVEALIREAEVAERGRAAGWWGVARAGWVGTALTATTAVAIVVGLGAPLVRGAGSGDEPGALPATITPTGPQLATASQMLIAAAVQQETNEKVSGTFFRVRSLQLNVSARVGSPRYTVERRAISESWMPMKPGAQSWVGWLNLGYRPASPADTAKWQAQGSPRSWQVGPDTITARPGKSAVTEMAFDQVPSGYYLTGNKPLTAQQIAALPTDPVKLRAALGRAVERDATAAERDRAVFTAAGRLLFDMPSPPKLRGAALRVLAELPGTHVRTGVKDPIGRIGTEFTMSRNPKVRSDSKAFPFGGVRYIIDPATGRLLSSMYGKPGATVILESGWTDQQPSPPSATIR